MFTIILVGILAYIFIYSVKEPLELEKDKKENFK